MQVRTPDIVSAKEEGFKVVEVPIEGIIKLLPNGIN